MLKNRIASIAATVIIATMLLGISNIFISNQVKAASAFAYDAVQEHHYNSNMRLTHPPETDPDTNIGKPPKP
jgi:hypothetical protein